MVRLVGREAIWDPEECEPALHRALRVPGPVRSRARADARGRPGPLHRQRVPADHGVRVCPAVRLQGGLRGFRAGGDRVRRKIAERIGMAERVRFFQTRGEDHDPSPYDVILVGVLALPKQEIFARPGCGGETRMPGPVPDHIRSEAARLSAGILRGGHPASAHPGGAKRGPRGAGYLGGIAHREVRRCNRIAGRTGLEAGWTAQREWCILNGGESNLSATKEIRRDADRCWMGCPLRPPSRSRSRSRGSSATNERRESS